MFWILHGNDFEKRKKATDELARFFGDIPRHAVDELSFVSQGIGDFLQPDLFSGPKVFVFFGALEKADNQEIFLEKLKDAKDSENKLIFSDAKLLAEFTKRAGKHAEEIREFKLPPKPRDSANFVFVNYFAARKKKEAWASLVELTAEGEAPEALSGALFWKIKTMLASRRYGPFTELELKKISSKMVDNYHRAHSGLLDFRVAMEEMVLESL